MSDTHVLDRLREDRDSARDAAIAMASAEDFDPSTEAYVELESRSVKLDGQIEQLTRLMEARSAADALDGKFSKVRSRQEDRRNEVPQTRQSWGEEFTRSDEFRTYRGRGQSAMFTIDDDVQNRALPTGVADLVAAGIKPIPYRSDVSANPAPTPLMDNITQIQVQTNAIEFVSWAKKAGGATKVAEKAAKPSAEFGPTVTSTTLDTFAVYTQLTRQLIEDYSAVRDKINNELQRDVARAEEADATAVLAAASAVIPDVVNADLLAGIRAGMGVVQAAGYNPTTVLLNPADWAKLDVSVFAQSSFGPTVGQNFWGLRPIASNSQAAGTAIVGDFATAVEHYYRSAIALYITDSHGDTFLSNVFTLLAERRSKTAVVRPQALVEAKIA